MFLSVGVLSSMCTGYISSSSHADGVASTAFPFMNFWKNAISIDSISVSQQLSFS